MEIKYQNLILQSNEEETYFLIVGCEEDAEKIVIPLEAVKSFILENTLFAVAGV